MRYHNNRLAPAKFRQRFVYKLLVLCICIRGSFIKDKYGSIFKEYSAYCYPLFFSSGKVVTAVAYDRLSL